MSRRAALLEIQRLVPSAAALRPSRVVANFQVTNGRAVVHGERPGPVERPGRGRPGARPRPRCRRRAAPAAPPAATGLVSAWANTTRRTPAAISAPAHGPVRPVWLQGSRVTTAVAPRAASPASCRAAASACGRARAAVEALGDLGAVVVDDHAADARVRPQRDPRARGQDQRSLHRPTLGGVALGGGGGHLPLSSSSGPRASRVLGGGAAKANGRPDGRPYGHRLRALPIRTLTVGPGVPPGQPVTGCDRVADFHRRLGISPTPEHASTCSFKRGSCGTKPATSVVGVPGEVSHTGLASRSGR